MIFCGFGVIAVIAFLWPNAGLSSSDGKCLIGLPNKVLIPLLTYDIFIHVGLISLFVLLLLPYLRLRDILLHQPPTKKPTVEQAVVQRGNDNTVPANSGHAIEILTTTSVETWSENTRCSPKSATSSCQMLQTCPSCKRVKVRSNNLWNLAIRSLCGSVMVLVPTIVNLVLIYCWRGKEQGRFSSDPDYLMTGNSYLGSRRYSSGDRWGGRRELSGSIVQFLLFLNLDF